MLQMLWLTLAGEQQAHTTLVATSSHECATAPETHEVWQVRESGSQGTHAREVGKREAGQRR